ncbi:acyl-CoA dehydrogenase [Mycolicibacterium mageritense DSM 44476 = CIP 104973]|uniref:Acyl-CoA dehydrogenase n=1 Tax=Mycolicibacterium mageritense TaxID=53462 RepID=A0AAI8XNI0_MYCME|nr:acyl-CoA dehydrogenase family protein [Mycolicibacterium mageritense]MCC9180658.1 acyl-CoA dehydrogenase family protein [Mycolicibacterium mageritense]CDO23045.1 acyl-CoA dehydrogenase [Mycolicibacterium mageritense DSM 44476 = CIP 104973]BBX32414.1 acyl-CoA dehydrogenase [Mycolicibacterium mageritense]BDY28917.1 Acyl-CoA dehydrogenase [Mycolicibacterium mageritense]GJJ21261.1 acyl-CoA dehydrogenase [Mycolicibacterium mageritense]
MTLTSQLDADAEEFLGVVNDFCVSQVAPRAQEIDLTGEFFPDLLAAAAEIGLQGLIFTEDGNIDPTMFALAHETTELVASYSGAVALGISISRLHGYLLAAYAPPHLRDRWLPGLIDGTVRGSFALSEPHSGTDIRAGRTVARVVDPVTVSITGEKAWITQSPVAHFCIVLTKLGSPDRDAETAAFVVPLDTEGVTVGADEPMSGFRGMPMANVHFDDCRIPASWRLDVDGFRGMLEGLNLARLDAGCYGVGFMRAALRETSAYVRDRQAFGKTLADLQIVQEKLGHLHADYLAARSLLREGVASFAAGGGGDAHLISAAKMVASDAAMRHAVEAVQLHGGYGAHLHYPVQRLMRDAKITQIIDGTSEIHALMLGRAAARADWS